MPRKEDLTDMMKPEAYTDKDADGKFVMYVGRTLVFNYEGSKTYIKITKIDRKNQKMWGQHIKLYDYDKGISHYGHDVDSTDMEHVFCRDCQVEISQSATEDGEVKAMNRQDEIDAAERAKLGPTKDEKKRRFRYELLGQDGTIKKFEAGKRKKIVEISKILGHPTELSVVPVIYYPPKYAEAAMYSDQQANWNPNAVKNPHLQVLQGDPDLGEPAEFYIVGDVLAEIEVMT